MIIICYHYFKPKYFFSCEKNKEYILDSTLIQLKLNSISHRLSCGDFIFDNEDETGKVITQRQSLNCYSPVEKECYNSKK